MKIVHKFEIAKLGKAPFRVIGSHIDVGPKVWVENGVRVECGAEGQPMGSCDYCGTGIKFCFTIQGAEGRKFVVGSSCVEKTNDKGSRVYTDVERQMRKYKREIRHANEAKKIAELKELLADSVIQDMLRALPHPNKYYATELKQTLLDYANWTMDNVHCGTTAKLKTLRHVKKLLNQPNKREKEHDEEYRN